MVEKRFQGIKLVLPVIIVMGVFTIFPLIQALMLSFTNKHLLRDTSFYVGLDNYIRLLGDDVFWLSFFHSIILTVSVVLLQIVLGLLLAWAMKQNVPGMSVFKSIIMASWVIPVAATVTMFKFMAQPDIGFINIILKNLGFEHLNKYWFGDVNYAFIFIIILHLWRNVPFYGVAFFAAMNAIDNNLYEAADMDGANAFRKFIHITLPGIRNMIVVMVTIHVLWTFNNFDFVYLATGGGPVNVTDVLPVYVYRQSWTSYTIGYGSAIGTVMLIVLFIYFIIYIKIHERQTN